MIGMQPPARLASILVLAVPGILAAQGSPPCIPHDRACPAPPVIEAGSGTKSPLTPPSDALVLFNGKDLSRWRDRQGGPAPWRVVKGYLEVVPATGAIETAGSFGDVQLHLEWATPFPPEGKDQDRGNSGVFLMGRYEVQILDSWANPTYPDGEAAAVYGQYPPLVDASRPAGDWQIYDIVFRRPRFDPEGRVVSPAVLTVFHNGVLVQDHVQLTGPTGHQRRPPYEVHPDRLPLMLQDHQHAVRFRNIWVRSLEP